MTDMQVTRRQVTDLRPDPDNVRTHSPRNLESIRESLTRFGQVKPIVLSADGQVAAGNGTLEAARQLGWESVWVVTFDGSVEEARAYAIADNRTAELASWDHEALLESLTTLDADLLASTGFTTTDMDDLVKAWGRPDDLDDLDPGNGDPFGDGLVRVTFRVPEILALQWAEAVKATGQKNADAGAAEVLSRLMLSQVDHA